MMHIYLFLFSLFLHFDMVILVTFCAYPIEIDHI